MGEEHVTGEEAIKAARAAGYRGRIVAITSDPVARGRMLAGGASMAEIAEVLRHRSPQTTEIYAKVDFRSLRALALPWPGKEATQ